MQPDRESAARTIKLRLLFEFSRPEELPGTTFTIRKDASERSKDSSVELKFSGNGHGGLILTMSTNLELRVQKSPKAYEISTTQTTGIPLVCGTK